MTEELLKPDPWYVRLEIANEHERMANHLGERARMFPGDAGVAIEQVMFAHIHRADVIRRELQREADREKCAEEDARERPHKVAAWS